MLGQLNSKMQQKELAELKIKEEGLKERQRLELAVKMAQEAEEKKQIEKRIKLKNLTEQDRKAKEHFRIVRAGDQPTEDPDNLMSKVFVRETHESYGRRAKNDLVVGYITEKFLSKPSLHAPATNVEEIVKKRNEAQELEQQERLKRRKEKEREMKLTLDLQVQKLAKEKEAVKKQQLELGAKISRDVETFEQEQKRKKTEQI